MTLIALSDSDRHKITTNKWGQTPLKEKSIHPVNMSSR